MTKERACGILNTHVNFLHFHENTMHAQQLFLSLFFCIVAAVNAVTAQQHIAYQAANNLVVPPYHPHFIVSAGIAYAQVTIATKVAQPFWNGVKSGAQYYTSDDASLLPEEKQQISDQWHQAQTDCINAIKKPKRLLCLVAAYLLLQHISKKMVHCPPLYQNTSYTEAFAATCLPLTAAYATNQLIQSYFQRQQLTEQQTIPVQQQAAPAVPANQQLTAPRTTMFLMTILTAVAVALVQYYTWFKVHDHFQPWVMPTQHDHMVQFTGYHLAPAVSNLVIS